MSTYRVGNHHSVTIVRDGDGHRCDLAGHDCDRGHLVGIMLTAEDAALAVEALNGTKAALERQALTPTPSPVALVADSCTCALNGSELGCPRHGAVI